MAVLKEVTRWLGPTRTRIVAALLVGVVFSSVFLWASFSGESWTLAAQMGLFWLLLVGVGVVAGTRFSGTGQRRFWSAVGPSLILIGLGVLVPRWALFFGGAGIGWLIISQFVLRGGVRMEYQSAIKALRRGDYAGAVGFMDHLVAAEPDDLEHWRFRAELYRLAGDLPKAQADYEQMRQIDPDHADAYIGLAEVFAQQGKYEEARRYAEEAHQRQPQNWMTAYNLGMIEDRLGHAQAALHCLDETITLGVPSSRYWLLIRLWRARCFYQLGKLDETRGELDRMRQQTAGLREWQMVFESEHAAALRGMLESDVKLAEELLDPQAALDRLAVKTNAE